MTKIEIMQKYDEAVSSFAAGLASGLLDADQEKAFKEQYELFKAGRDALRRNAEDDKAREEGLLVRLPCKVGDEVFFNLWNIKSQKYETLPGTIKNVRYDAIDGSVMVSNGEYFRVLGRDAFLTRAEAEAAFGRWSW